MTNLLTDFLPLWEECDEKRHALVPLSHEQAEEWVKTQPFCARIGDLELRKEVAALLDHPLSPRIADGIVYLHHWQEILVCRRKDEYPFIVFDLVRRVV